MTLTILNPLWTNFYHPDYRMWFDLNGDTYKYVQDSDYLDRADLLICNNFYTAKGDAYGAFSKYRSRCSLFMQTYHVTENLVSELHVKSQYQLHDYDITHAIDPSIDNDRIVFSDFLFNLVKAFYRGFDWPSDTRWKWRHAGQSMYVIPDWMPGESKGKIFVSPSHLHNEPGRQPFRAEFVEWITSRHWDKGHIGASGFNDQKGLLCQTDAPSKATINDLYSLGKNYRHTEYRPPHQSYFQDSFVSIYCETIESGTSLAATEKTFDPLIKGHFILPFSCQGFIQFIQKHYGFRFPDFIDYSYDGIKDDHARFKAYLAEIDRLLHLPDWPEQWNKNRPVLEHNQQIFRDRPYHRVDLQRLLRD